MVLSEISVYPVKSCGGSSSSSAELDRFGLVGDRRWLVTDTRGHFLTQRECPNMAMIRVEQHGDALHLSCRGQSLVVSVPPANAASCWVQVWEDRVLAQHAGAEADAWLSASLDRDCQLVHMGDDCYRRVDGHYALSGETVSFADGFPLLLISQASLDDLNSRLSAPVPMNRFRPNLVVDGCEAFAEDRWRRIRVGAIELEVAKACSRCVMPSIDQHTGEKNSEVLSVLASYRRGADRQTYFGQNLLYSGDGRLNVGDPVEVLELV